MSNKDNNDVDLNLRQLKDYFYDDTYMNLINCLDSYEKKDYMSFVVWAAVFNERLLNDLAQFFNAHTKSRMLSGLRRTILEGLSNLSEEEKVKYFDILDTMQTIQKNRNEAVHNPISVNKAMGLETYDALKMICTYYIDTRIAENIYRKQRNIINESSKNTDEVSLQLMNIGKISYASIKIDGLTVLVGENATGKSTLGRALFLITKTLRNMENSVIESQRRKIEQVIRMTYRKLGLMVGYSRIQEIEKISKALVTCPPASIKGVFIDNLSSKEEQIFLKTEDGSSAILNKVIQDIINIRNMSYADLSKQVVTNEVGRVFAGKICKIGTDNGTIVLKYSDESENIIKFYRNDNGDECVDLIQNQEIRAMPCMIEPSVNLFDPNRIMFPDDVIDSFNARKATSEFEEILSNLIEGRIIISHHKAVFEQKGLDELVEMKNLSSGVKTIATLEWMLRRGEISRDSVLILDEPEVSLHPEWQIRYAQILVRLQKELNLHILIMTHSPYFLQALEYSAKLGGLGNKYHCYFPKDNNDITRISCVDKYPSYAYKKMIEPFAELDTMREQLESITNEN